MIKRGILFLFLIWNSFGILGQEVQKVTPIGAMLTEGGYYDSTENKVVGGVGFAEIRLGIKLATEKYRTRIEAGYTYNKLGFNDVYIERSFSDKEYLRLGYYYHRFGLQGLFSGSHKNTIEQPTANDAFGYPRLFGAMYVKEMNKLNFAGSLFAEADVMKNTTEEARRQGVGAIGRMVYVPVKNESSFFHVGVSGAVQTSPNNDVFVFATNFPKKLGKVNGLNLGVDHSQMVYKFTPEMCYSMGRVALESQYYYAHVARRDKFESYNGSGAYGILRGMIKGENYKYKSIDSSIAIPKAGSLEVLLGYSYTDLNDEGAKLYGGVHKDLSVCMNYYITEHITWRVRLSNAYAYGGKLGDVNLNGISTRLMILF